MESQGGGNPDLVVYKLTEGYVVYANGASVACGRVEELTECIGRMLTAARPDRAPEIGGVCEHPEEKVQSQGLARFCSQCGHRWQVEAPPCAHPQDAWRTRPASQNIICLGCGAEVGKLPPVFNEQPPVENDWLPKAQALGGSRVPRGLDAEYENLRRLAHGVVSGIVRSDQIWAIARQVCPHIPQVDIGQALDQAEHQFYEAGNLEPGRLAPGETGEYEPQIMGPIRMPTDFGPEDRSLFGKEPKMWSASTAPQGMMSIEEGAQQCGCPGCAYEAGAGLVCVACHNGVHPHRMVEGREYSDRAGKSFVFQKGAEHGNGGEVRAGEPRGADPVPADVQPRHNGDMGKPGTGKPVGRRKRRA